MGPPEHAFPDFTNQGRARRARSRRCLLKGCEGWFRPVFPLARYCSDACRQAACRWSRWQACRRYRATPAGRNVRRAQSRRYRQRVRERKLHAAKSESPGGTGGCEGHHQRVNSEKIACSRPGCYETFDPSRRSPLRKFCCSLCRQALRRVLKREARWWKASGVPRGEPASWWACRPDRPPG